MKAAVYLGPGKMEIQDVPDPVCGKDEVVVKVQSCAVCGTDVRIYTHGQKNVVPPHIIGHEIAGTVAELGSAVKLNDIKVGDKVTVVTCVGCGTCKFCRQQIYNLCDTPRYLGYFYAGGFAEYIKIPAEAVTGNNIVKVTGDIEFPVISMIEPLSCCINGQEFLNVQPGDTVVVFGAGPIGCMHSEIAKAQGAGKVVMFDVSDTRLELAHRFRIDYLFNSTQYDPVKQVMELTDNTGADVVITACSVNAVQEQAVAMVAKRGRISFFAGLGKDNPYIKFDSNVIHYKEAAVYGAFASHRKQYVTALDYIQSGKIDAGKFVTHTFPLEKIVTALETTRTGVGLKSVIII